MASIFTKIINGEIPCYKIAEDERFFAFLDIHPLTQGHTLVVPKQEIDYFFDLPPVVLADMMQFAQRVAVAIKHVVPCKRVGMEVVGLEVPHAHIHLIPLNSEADANFRNPKLTCTPEELAVSAAEIRSAFK